MEALAERYRAYLLSARRRSPLTAEVYLREASLLGRWLGERGSSPEAAASSDILGYLVWRQTGGAREDTRREDTRREPLSRKTMARIVSSVHAFYKFMRLEGIRADDPSELIETPKQDRVLPSVLPPEEVDRFLASIDPGSPRGLRDRALFELIYSCGLRISEAACLTFDQLYLKERVIRVVGKRRKERLVPFGEEATLRANGAGAAGTGGQSQHRCDQEYYEQ